MAQHINCSFLLQVRSHMCLNKSWSCVQHLWEWPHLGSFDPFVKSFAESSSLQCPPHCPVSGSHLSAQSFQMEASLGFSDSHFQVHPLDTIFPMYVDPTLPIPYSDMRPRTSNEMQHSRCSLLWRVIWDIT